MLMKWYDTRIWKWVLVTAVVLFAAFTLGGCKSKQYVMVPEYHTEYVCRTDTFTKADSVYVKDSVYVYQNGDTVTIHKIAYRDRWHYKYKVKLDTIIKRDSVPYPVVRKLTKNEQRMMDIGRISLIFWGMLFAGLVVILIYWYRNKKC